MLVSARLWLSLFSLLTLREVLWSPELPLNGLNYYPSADGSQICILGCELFPYVQMSTQQLHLRVPQTPECQWLQYWIHWATKKLLFVLRTPISVHGFTYWTQLTKLQTRESFLTPSSLLLLPPSPNVQLFSKICGNYFRPSSSLAGTTAITYWLASYRTISDSIPPYLLYTLAGEIPSNIQKELLLTCLQTIRQHPDPLGINPQPP